MSPSPSLAQLTYDPHPHLAALRTLGPAAWVEALGGWMVTGHASAAAVMKDSGTFTVDDPRFTTSRVVGPSMLSTDGPEHARQRQPFVAPFSPRATRSHFAAFVQDETARLIAQLRPRGEAELRTELAGPLAAASMRLALGLERIPVEELLGWYRAIVQAVAEVTAGRVLPESGLEAYRSLTSAVSQTLTSLDGQTFLGSVLSGAAALTEDEIYSNTAVLLFGGIETTEGMVANLAHHVLTEPGAIQALRDDPSLVDAAVEESLRLEPAAPVVDRYATRDVSLGDARIRRGDLVVVSLAGANRDPSVFPDPDRFDPRRPNLRRQLAFATGPHVCVGLHLARLEARCALENILALPDLRYESQDSTAPAGLVFRKPEAVWAGWNPASDPE